MHTLFMATLLLLQDAPNLCHVKAKLGMAASKVGQPVKLEVSFDVAQNAHISDEAPLAIKLSGDGLTFEKPVLHYGDAQKPTGAAPKFAETISAASPGQHTVDLQLSYYVCTAELCNHVTDHQTLALAASGN